MTLLHTNFISGALFTTNVTGGQVGPSGINDITGRVNFGGYDFPQASNIVFTTGSFGNVEKVVTSGTDHYYESDISYTNTAAPYQVVESGLTIGSVITTNLYYSTGSLWTATGSLSAGSVTLT